jgi:hypothetical protein
MRNSIFLLAFCLAMSLCAQSPLGYQTPPPAILDLIDVPLAPTVLMDNDREHMILLSRDAYKSIEELSQKEMRLGGLRIDPATNIGITTTKWSYAASAKTRKSGRLRACPRSPAWPT